MNSLFYNYYSYMHKRSETMLIFIFLLAISQIVLSCDSSKSVVKNDSFLNPNLIIIQTDEHNFRTLGCYRDQLDPEQANIWGKDNNVNTPNIDFLADNGVLFTKFYAASPVCTPSRSSFISGLYPQNNGAPKNDLPLNENVVTYSKVLLNHGYKTAFVGKWHLDGTGKPQWEPERKFGFEDNRYMFNRGHWKKLEETPQGPRVASRDKDGAPNYDLGDADELTFTTDFLVNRGIAFIEKNKNDPFSLYLSIPDPHGPDKVRSPYDTMFNHLNFEAPFTYNKSREGVPSWSSHDKRASIDQSQYFGMVKCIDDNVGKIIAYLKENNLLNNTIILFTSDHGDLRGEHHKDNKGNPLEASAKIPFIVYYPNKIPKGSIINNAINTVDFSPTILSFMGKEIPSSMNGRDFSLLMTNPDQQQNWHDITFMRNGGRANMPRWVAAVTSRYKLILSQQDEPWLIDMEIDPNELKNFIHNPENQKLVSSLAQQLKIYGDQHKDPFLQRTKMAKDLKKLLNL